MLIKSREKITKSYDVIVIGSGLGGMTLANKMARDGRKILLLEAHNKLGGFATWFYRKNKKHVFDISLHGFPFGMKKTCRKYWSKEIADHITQIKKVKFTNPQYTLESEFTQDDFTSKLVNHFGLSEEVVNSFYTYIQKMNFYDDQSMTNKELFEKFFPGRNDVMRFLMEPIVYANGSTLDDPAITYGIVFSNFMKKGVWTFKGGTDVIIKMMKDELIKNGVDIKMHSLVQKILVSDGSVSGVELKDGPVYSKAVASNANLFKTVFDLVGKDKFSAPFIEKAKKVRMNSSSCQVYIGLKPEEKIPFLGELIFTSTHPTFDTNELMSLDISSRTFSFYYPENRPYDQEERTAIVSSTNAHYKDWYKMSDDEYAHAKKKMIEETLISLEKIIPDIRDKVDFIEAATPKTVEKYTHHHLGSSFGTKFEGLEISNSLQKEVSGLYHAGSVGIIMSGWLGAANYGVIQSNEIETYLLDLEKNNDLKKKDNIKREKEHV